MARKVFVTKTELSDIVLFTKTGPVKRGQAFVVPLAQLNRVIKELQDIQIKYSDQLVIAEEWEDAYGD